MQHHASWVLGRSIYDVPEYLAPGVYVEEVSYRAKSIEGVSTTTNRFVGAIRSGVGVAVKWVGFLLVGILLGVAGSTAVSWAWRRGRKGRPRPLEGLQYQTYPER